PSSIGLYSIRFTLQGTYLQNFTKASTDFSSSLIPFQTTYSYVIRLLVLEYQYCNASRSSVSGKFLVNGIISLRISSIAECSDTANLNFTPSSAIFLIIFETPEVETVIRLADIPRPSSEVILSMAFITLL